jgi:hypothetical protein
VIPVPGPSPVPVKDNPGSLRVVGQSGVPAMHAGLMPNGRVFFLDKVENYTQIKLKNGQYAYSSEYDPVTNSSVGLSYTTNAFCSGGTFLPDGRIVSFGGNAPLTEIDPTVGDGFTAIRYLQRSASSATYNGQSWSEPGNKMSSARWYASVQTMGDGTIFVCSGSLNGLDPTDPTNNNPTYEMLSSTAVSSGGSIPLPILERTQPYFMYPFVHLLSDGTLYIFAARSSVRFDPHTNTTLTSYPDIPGDYRTYPNTGGSIMFPLTSANNWAPTILICGGGSYQDITSPTDASCGKISPLAATPMWELDSMPEGRVMVESVLLPDGTSIWANGANLGAQGFGIADSPTVEVLIYDPTQALGRRWSSGPSSAIPRLYHSVMLLLLDGTILISGSNPVQMPVLVASLEDPYPTEFRVEIYTPPYLSGTNANRRPTGVVLSSKTLTANGSTFMITFKSLATSSAVNVALYNGGYITHSVHMGHRMVLLDNTGFVKNRTAQTITVSMPPNGNVAPPGPYVVYIVVDGVPAVGQFVMVA